MGKKRRETFEGKKAAQLDHGEGSEVLHARESVFRINDLVSPGFVMFTQHYRKKKKEVERVSQSVSL